MYYKWKNIKIHVRTINIKYQVQHEMKNLSYLIDHILYQIFKIILNISSKTLGEKTVNHSIRIYVNTLENRIMFKIKTGYLKLLTPETIKWLGSIKSKVTKNKNGKDIPHLEVTISSISTF